ncbi:MAG TPA: DUF3828 domain-containing protein [Longimicrobium sp.]|nr:DUF3828 domain-containing protein [Longimicrobium sp.]
MRPFRLLAARPVSRRSRPIIPLSRHLLRALAALSIAGVAQGCGAPARASSAGDPAAVVDSLYRDHFAHEQNWDATYQRQRARFAPDLAALLDADTRAAAANADEIVGLDFDPLTYAQDTMTGYELAPATREGSDAIVPVTVRQDSARTALRVRLARVGTGWRVSNIHYPEGDLAAILRQLAADRRPKP